MYLRPSGHIYGPDSNTLGVALATGYRSARSAPRLGSRRGMVPVRSARTPQFEERVYQWSRRHRKGSACGCGFAPGAACGLLGSAQRFRLEVGVPLRTALDGDRRCVRVPTWRSAIPGPVRHLPGWGMCRDVEHPVGLGHRRRGPAGRCADLEVGVPLPACHHLGGVVSPSQSAPYKGRTPGPDGPGVPV